MPKDLCCGRAIIRAGNSSLSARLLEYGQEAYADLKREQRVIMWVFAFFDENKLCPKCKSEIQAMVDWFSKNGLFDSPSRAARIVIEGDPENHNMLFNDLGLSKLPTFIYCDANCRIFDIRFEFPSVRWLNDTVLPFFQSDASIF